MKKSQDPIKSLFVKTITEKLDLPHYRVFLFGSRVRNQQLTHRSDYDIGVESSQKIPLSILHELRENLEKIPILQKIDLVDLSRVSKEFKKTALQQKELLYEK